MFHAAKEGNFPRPPISLLSILGSLTMAAAPFLSLADPQVALLVLAVGPVFFIYLAGMQLIPNVMKAGMPNQRLMRIFMGLALLEWLVCAVHLFIFPLPWWAIGSFILLPTLLYIPAINLKAGLRFCGPTSLSLGFLFGFFWNISAALTLIIFGSHGVDSALHLLALGQITGHIFVVGGRVAGFFSGDYIMKEERLIALFLCWQILPFIRGFDGLLFIAPPWLIGVTSGSCFLLLLIWGFCMLARLQKV